MRAGQLDRKITIQHYTTTRSPLGDEVLSWVNLVPPVWAQVLPVSGREFANATLEQKLTEKTQRFRIRWLASARKDTKLRIVYDGETYDVKHIAEIGRRVGLELVGVVLGAS
jgi:SPP1 family predicted phage head-tail adaptor